MLGITSVVITHDVAEVSKFADHACIIAGGKVIGSGAPNELIQSDEPMIQQFMQGLADGPVPFHYPAAPLAEELIDAGEHA